PLHRLVSSPSLHAALRISLSVAMVSPAVTSIVPRTAIRSPGRAALSAARSVVSSDTVTVGLAAQVGEADPTVTVSDDTTLRAALDRKSTRLNSSHQLL